MSSFSCCTVHIEPYQTTNHFNCHISSGSENLHSCFTLLFIVLSVTYVFLTFYQYRPDARVIQLIRRMGSRVQPNQKRVLCMNKIDLVKKKKDLVKVSEEFNLPGYERYAFLLKSLESG